MNKLSLLLALDCFQKFTGSELYAYYLVRELIKEGHRVDLYAHFARGKPLGRKYRKLHYVSKEEIATGSNKDYDVILAMHSRTIQFLLESIRDIPFITIHHGKIELERAVVNRRVFRYVCVSEEIKQLAVDSWGVPPERVLIVPNFIDLREYRQRKSPGMDKGFKLMWGGTIYDYYRHAVHAAIEIVQQVPNASLDLVGEDILNLETEFSTKRIRFLGLKRITSRLLAKYHLVFGRGRIALECLATGIPVYILGNEGSNGLLSSDNFESMLKTNFAGRSSPLRYSPKNVTIMVEEVESFLRDRNRHAEISSSYNRMAKNFDLRLRVAQIKDILYEVVREAQLQSH